MDEQACWVALSLVNQPFDLRAMLRRYGRIGTLFDNVDARNAIGRPLADDPDGALRSAEGVIARCGDLGVSAWSYDSPRYPAVLRTIARPPPVLYAVGRRAPLDRPAVALVGSRRCSGYGRWAARTLGRQISAAGVCVVSGMAFGVDAEAHDGALRERGGTIAVLGGGPELASPASLERLYRRIAREQLVLSEFPPGTTPRPAYYPRRNRVVAGLAQAVVVVEAAGRSGALITAREALAEGREVMAVPGPIDSATSAGTNRLLVQGAAPVTGAEDVLGVLEGRPDGGDGGVSGEDAPADPAEAQLTAALAAGTSGIDELMRRTGMDLVQVRAALLRLRLQGRVRSCGGDRYCSVE